MKNKKACILDYGSGNVGSLFNLLNNLDCNVKVSNDPEDIKGSTHILLPGVGAFGESMKKINKNIPLNVLKNEVNENKKPFLGICVGMQVLADKGYEFGEHDGLGWISGNVVKLKAKILPHIGWNNVEILKESQLFSDIENLRDFYFVNSYAFKVEDKNFLIAKTEYEEVFCSAVEKNNIFGVQFHPEKSQNSGKKVIQNFLNIA